MYDIIIIGAGCAGLTAAVYGARAEKSVLVLESGTIGGQISSAPKVENYPGIRQISGMELSDNLYEQAAALGVTVELETAEKIVCENKQKVVVAGGGGYSGKSVILATGSNHRKLGVPNEEKLTGKGVSYCAICDGAFFKGADVAVVGGGSAALQNAEFLSHICRNVYLIHRRDEFRGEQTLADRLKAKDNVTLCLHSVVKGLEGGDFLTAAVVGDLMSGKEVLLPLKGLFVSIGQVPDNRRFADCVRLDESGYVLASEDCRTSADGIFAAGDCRTKAVRQLVTAAADGAVSALAACRYADSL